MSTAKKHIHKYYRARIATATKGFLWACALPTCNHHMPEHMESFLPGKATICWSCGELTTLDSRTMAMDKPLCTDCDPKTVSLENPDENAIEALKEMGIIGKLE